MSDERAHLLKTRLERAKRLLALESRWTEVGSGSVGKKPPQAPGGHGMTRRTKKNRQHSGRLARLESTIKRIERELSNV